MPSVLFDVLVYGDEVESILTAVSASQAGAKVVLARRSTGPLGGLSVRGGLSYMDITPAFVAGLFESFLNRCGVVRVALDPQKAANVLMEMLQENQITLLSGVETKLQSESNGWRVQLGRLNQTTPVVGATKTPHLETLQAKVVIDTTPDADLACDLGMPYIEGLGGLFGPEQNFLGVSPVFRIAGVPFKALQEFEADLRAKPNLANRLEEALPYHEPELREAYLTRPTYAPDDMDYLDILNPVIGIDYHCWRHGSAKTYSSANIAIDGANISRLPDGTLGFNGMVAQAKALKLDLAGLIQLSQGGETPLALQLEMQAFERYLKEVGGFQDAEILPPAELYVRQTINLLAEHNMTARDAIAGGVAPHQAVGDFSYWLDLRGVVLSQHYPNTNLPKPIFNLGLGVTLPPTRLNLPNFGFVSRSAGYSPIGQGAGRIVQHNALLGEVLGIAAALSASSGRTLHQLIATQISEIQSQLASRRGQKELALRGEPTAQEAWLNTNALIEADQAVIEHLRSQRHQAGSVSQTIY